MNRTTIDHLAALVALVVVVYLLTRDTATGPAAAVMPNPNQVPDASEFEQAMARNALNSKQRRAG